MKEICNVLCHFILRILWGFLNPEMKKELSQSLNNSISHSNTEIPTKLKLVKHWLISNTDIYHWDVWMTRKPQGDRLHQRKRWDDLDQHLDQATWSRKIWEQQAEWSCDQWDQEKIEEQYLLIERGLASTWEISVQCLWRAQQGIFSLSKLWTPAKPLLLGFT